MINHKAILIDKNQQFNCELKIDGKLIDKRESGDFEVWYDYITDKIYEVKGFREIELKIV